MKKAEFFAIITPDSATSGDYISVTGTADRGLTYVLIELSDAAGTTLRTYSSPVSATGYFNYGFHVDMKPGQYTIRVSNPAIKNPLQKVLTVLPPRTPAPVVTTVAVTPDIPTAAITASLPVQLPTSPVVSTGSGSLSIASTPPGAFVYLDSVMMGKTPVELGNPGFGTHLVEIRSPGYMPYSVQVTVSEGAAVTLSPILVKNPSSLPLSPVTALAAFVICGAIAILCRKK
jgi:hypothetical protein